MSVTKHVLSIRHISSANMHRFFFYFIFVFGGGLLIFITSGSYDIGVGGRADYDSMVETSTQSFNLGGRWQRVLVILPSPLYTYKGADHRVMQVLKFLSSKTELRLSVVYYHSLHSEMGMDGEEEYQVLNDMYSSLGTVSIQGPLGEEGLEGTALKFDLVMFWVYELKPYLSMICRSIRQLQTNRASVRVLALVDDDSVSLRMAVPRAAAASITTNNMENVLLRMRPDHRIMAAEQPVSGAMEVPSLSFLEDLISIEFETYQVADAVATISRTKQRFLCRFVPGKPMEVLRYTVPDPPSNYRLPSGPPKAPGHLIFVGYNNRANELGINWFVSEVLPRVRDPRVVLHIVGHVRAKACTDEEQEHSRIVCHGPTKDVDQLYEGMSAAINLVMEPSGVSTKACAALVRGLPVISSELDGTVSGMELTDSLRRLGIATCKRMDAKCAAASIDKLLKSSTLWRQASTAALTFMAWAYSPDGMFADMRRVLADLQDRAVRVLVVGNSAEPSPLGDQIINLVGMLSQHSELGIHVAGRFRQPSQFDAMGARRYPSIDHIPSGLDFHIVVDLSWPPSLVAPPIRLCDARCRLILWLPWQLGSLPSVWVPRVHRLYDEVWVPSESTALQLIDNGLDRTRIQVMPAGVSCDASAARSELTPPMVDWWPRTTRWRGSGSILYYWTTDLSLTEINALIEAFLSAFPKRSESVSLVLHTTDAQRGVPPSVRAKWRRVLRYDPRIVWYRDLTFTPSDRTAMLRSASAVIVPPSSALLGTTVLEAMAYGVPVVLADKGVPIDKRQLQEVAYTVRGLALDCVDFPCTRSFEVCVGEVSGSRRECLEAVSRPHRVIMAPKDLSAAMRRIVEDPEDAQQKTERAQRLVLANHCWRRSLPRHAARIRHLLDDGALAAKRGVWRNSRHHRMLAPGSITSTDGRFDLVSRNGQWRLHVTDDTRLAVQNVDSLEVKWMSPKPQARATDCVPRCNLEVSEDCRLRLWDGRGRVVLENEEDPWTTRTRRQCVIQLNDHGILALIEISSNGEEVVLWSSE